MGSFYLKFLLRSPRVLRCVGLIGAVDYKIMFIVIVRKENNIPDASTLSSLITLILACIA